MLNPPLAARLERRREPSTFDAQIAGHVIKLIVGLIQEYGALTSDEIRETLANLKVDKLEKEVDRYLLCAREVGWLKQIAQGSHDYFIARNNMKVAATFSSKSTTEPKVTGPRRRLLIRDYWALNDTPRHYIITEAARGAIS